MLEFYQAYATYADLIDTVEAMLSSLAEALGATTRPFGDHAIDWRGPYARHTVEGSLSALGGLDPAVVADPERLREVVSGLPVPDAAAMPRGLLLMAAFEHLVEPKLVQPTFVTRFPVEVSPLARRSDDDPRFTDRFELFVAGMEVANAFSELNDPIDQRERFEAQARAREAGDEEAMVVDHDYVRALEYGMPPAAGCGIGVDRLVMLLTDRHAIREVILFPHMRPEAPAARGPSSPDQGDR
jgi:lysyl-tRNA synthetase class 2